MGDRIHPLYIKNTGKQIKFEQQPRYRTLWTNTICHFV